MRWARAARTASVAGRFWAVRYWEFVMAFRTVVLAMAMWASAAAAQSDPLAPLPDAPPPLVRVQAVPPQYRPVSPAPTTVLTGFAAYKQTLSARARSASVREATIQATIP